MISHYFLETLHESEVSVIRDPLRSCYVLSTQIALKVTQIASSLSELLERLHVRVLLASGRIDSGQDASELCNAIIKLENEVLAI